MQRFLWLSLSAHPRSLRLATSIAVPLWRKHAFALVLVSPCLPTSTHPPTHILLSSCTTIMQVIPFDLRTDVFLSMLERERVKHRSGHMGGPPGFQARIRRSHLYEDSISAFRRMRTGLKGRMQIEFINEMGLPEAGIDGGGLIKEFMNSLCKRAFDPQYALFAATQDDRLLYPSAVSHLAASDHLDHFVFLGRVLGKAMFESILVEPQFAG